jgi:tRNA-specific 2-thiouridylase
MPIEKWKKIEVQGRYKQRSIKAKEYHFDGENLTVIFEEKVSKFAPGQILAVYDGDTLLGGGIISRS